MIGSAVYHGKNVNSRVARPSRHKVTLSVSSWGAIVVRLGLLPAHPQHEGAQADQG